MISARDEVIGVIQLINKRAKGWITLDSAERLRGRRRAVRRRLGGVRLGARVAGRHRARERAALRRGQDAVRQLREGLGHRDRVARSDDVGSLRARRRAHGRARARRSTAPTTGHYREVRFSRDDLTQIEYAALLHDFGKVGVREHVLVKAKKLYEHERELILQRFQLIKRGYKIEGLETKVRYLTGGVARSGRATQLVAVDRDIVAQGRRARRHHQVHPRRRTSRPCSTRAASSGSPRSPGMTLQRRDRRDAAVPRRTTRRAACRSGAARSPRTSGSRSTATSSTRTTSSARSRGAARCATCPTIAGAHHEKLDGTRLSARPARRRRSRSRRG